MVDMLLQLFISSGDWLNAAVSMERAFTVIKGVHFDKEKTQRFAKIIIPVLISFTILTNIHDPLHRHLVDDTEEQRTWCMVSYSKSMELFNSITKLFHFLTPFLLNLTSAVIIIIAISRSRAVAKKQMAFQKHLYEQLRQHRHLLISPIILIILNLPRLIISFLTGCMKSVRNPWIFLVGYFISCVPSLLTFIVFVLPSEIYMKQFSDSVNQIRMAIRRTR